MNHLGVVDDKQTVYGIKQFDRRLGLFIQYCLSPTCQRWSHARALLNAQRGLGLALSIWPSSPRSSGMALILIFHGIQLSVLSNDIEFCLELSHVIQSVVNVLPAQAWASSVPSERVCSSSKETCTLRRANQYLKHYNLKFSSSLTSKNVWTKFHIRRFDCWGGGLSHRWTHCASVSWRAPRTHSATCERE